MGKAVCVCTYVRLTYAYIYSIYMYVLSGALTVTSNGQYDRYSFQKYAEFSCTTQENLFDHMLMFLSSIL